MAYLLQFDGLAAPNPGEATAGAVLFSPEGKVVFEIADYLGIQTNNYAEYNGLLIGLRFAKKKGIKHIKIEGDSNLVIQQVKGLWKVKEPRLKPLFEEIMKLLIDFKVESIKHVYRDYNKAADALTNECLALKTGFVREY
jgi:ribonuclease HI